MRFYTHLAFGVLFGLLCYKFFGNAPLSALLVVGSVLPDIDMPTSFIGRRAKPISSAINFIFKHRGFFHTLYPAVILYLVLSFVDQSLALAISLGYLGHLLIDSLTPAGISFLPPLKLKMRGFILSGSIWDKAVFVILIALDAFLVMALF